MIKRFLYIVCLSGALSSLAQVTIIVDQLPTNHNDEDAIYLAGSLNSWSPGDDQYKLTDRTITIQTTQAFEYKFTLGSWDQVETTTSGGDVQNRKYDPSKDGDTVLVSIAGWKAAVSNTSLPDNITHHEMDIPQLNRKRDVWVCLPPNYDSESAAYPVVYMQDGQNLFDASLSFSGEWGADETIARLSKEHGLDLIVVGIANGGAYRISEYAPWVNAEYGGGEGEAFTEFLVETLKPFIDGNYRTKPSSFHTGIMGSSLGANISLYAGLKHPDVFSRVGAMSPALWFNPELFALDYHSTQRRAQKVLMNAGSREPSSVTSNMLKMKRALLADGYGSTQIHTSVTRNHGHNEAHWRATLEKSLLWLFRDAQFTNVPNGNSYAAHASGDRLTIFGDSAAAMATLKVYNMVGKEMQANSVMLSESTELIFDQSGLFAVVIEDELGKYTLRVLK
ncbi:MAG: alpha/beta hydrolase [Cyclobacteriaceae bacterium]